MPVLQSMLDAKEPAEQPVMAVATRGEAEGDAASVMSPGRVPAIAELSHLAPAKLKVYQLFQEEVRPRLFRASRHYFIMARIKH